jgi:TRAF3-interacting protein 1
MDYIQEDVDSMNKELEMWRSENKEHSIALKREQR